MAAPAVWRYGDSGHGQDRNRDGNGIEHRRLDKPEVYPGLALRYQGPTCTVREYRNFRDNLLAF